jgi:A/G-specific adenine glycosylase
MAPAVAFNPDGRAGIAVPLRKWALKHGREFPWRKTRDPYRLLVAELMLHRTRAQQVLPAYIKFIKAYPTIQSLSSASEEDVLALFAPLGLHWRARLAADLLLGLSHSPDQRVPTSSQILREFPGVSDYIAGAIACFSTNHPEVILDTNIVRVLGRVSGTPVGEGSRRTGRFKRLMQLLLPTNDPRGFYFALIDLAALVCTPTFPRCTTCPLDSVCSFRRRELGFFRRRTPVSAEYSAARTRSRGKDCATSTHRVGRKERVVPGAPRRLGNT